MNNQLLKKIASLFFLLLLSTLIANGQIPNESKPAEPTSAQADENDGDELIENIKRGELAEVAKILFAGTSADAVDKDGARPLCWAIRVNRRDIVELLLARGADVTKEEEDDSGTALDVAAALGHADLVKLLISRGAAVNHKDHGGHTALIVAAMGAMVKAGPPFLFKGGWGGDPDEKEALLLSQMGNEHKTVMELLLKAGADANIQADDCGFTALMVAAMSGNVEVVQLLLDKGAKVDLKSGDWDALGFAESFESPEAIAALWEAEDSDTAQALASWSQITAPGRRQVARLLRAARARN